MVMTSPKGYLIGLKTMVVDGLKQVFDAEFPDPDFRNIVISLEYPVLEHNFPSVWVDYEDVQDLQTAGIGHHEWSEPAADGSQRKLQRWRYGGFVTLTVVAFTALERDRLCDWLIAVLAFGDEEAETSEFRQYVTANEFIAADLDWDRIKITATAANQGTPWGTDDMLYERTLALSIWGEFVSDGIGRPLVPLSEVNIYPRVDGVEPDLTDGDGKGAWLP